MNSTAVCEQDVIASRIAEQPRGGQSEQRADAFPARSEDVVADSPDPFRVQRIRTLPDQPLDFVKIALKRLGEYCKWI